MTLRRRRFGRRDKPLVILNEEKNLRFVLDRALQMITDV
jgi:molybdopterin-guanine dinucleotide biosynthesis protein A